MNIDIRSKVYVLSKIFGLGVLFLFEVILIIVICDITDYKIEKYSECSICRKERIDRRYFFVFPDIVLYSGREDKETEFSRWYRENIKKSHKHRWNWYYEVCYSLLGGVSWRRYNLEYAMRSISPDEERKYLEAHFSDFKDMKEYIYRMVNGEGKEIYDIRVWWDKQYEKEDNIERNRMK